MDPIRVIGRIDLAEQIRVALTSAGADARVATAAPMAVVAETGKDGTGVDVLANGIDVCAAIKRTAPDRPVVMITWDAPGSDATRALAASAATTARGPDAFLPWPATGADILAACERAREAARVERPWTTWRIALIRIALVAIAVVYLVALIGDVRALATGVRSQWARVAVLVGQAGILGAAGAWSWARARERPSRWRRARALVTCALAALAILDAVVVALG